MKVIGITGPIGAGKSYVASLIGKRGIPLIDTDKIYHQLISGPSGCTEKIHARFGDEVINCSGGVDRKRLSEIVFSDGEKLRDLNSITHRCVCDRTEEILSDFESRGEKAVAVEVPMMFESGFDKRCDAVICVTADTDVRVRRIIERNGFSAEEAKKRIKSQKKADEYIEKSTFTVYNNGSEDLDVQIDRILAEILG